MSENRHDPSDDGQKKSGTGTGILLMIPIVLIGFLIIKFLFSSDKKVDVGSDNKRVNQTEQSSSNESSGTWRVVEHKPVELGNEYGEVYYLLSIDGFNFSGATQPYRVINEDGKFADGEIGQDVSDQLPKDSKGNMKLRFKSRSGRKGNATIIVSQLK